MIRGFINLNIKLSSLLERLFAFEKNDAVLLNDFFDGFDKTTTVADIGGGKKPAKCLIDRKKCDVEIYDGYDIDMKELCQAKEHYDNIYKTDLTDISDELLVKKYDKIICLNTLEHVDDATKSIDILAHMLNQGGSIYLKLPCKHAVFAKLNLALPQEIKKKILHFIFPHKSGDGFKVIYDKSSPKEYIKMLEDVGFEIEEIRLIKWSSYFSFFFPLYVVWRLITVVQNSVIDDYCESFEIVARYRKYKC